VKANGMSSSNGIELRRSRRLDIGKLVVGHLLPSGVPIKIRDIGFGGFAMETRAPVRVGSVLDFRFTSKNGLTFVLTAEVAHSRQVSSPLGPEVYLSGLEFADKQAAVGQRAEDLIDKINWILSFYDEAWRDSDRAEPDVRPSTDRTGPRRRAPRTR